MTNITDVGNRMIALRGQQVIIDADVAELYGVETKRVNEAVANNPEKFPKGYVFQIDNQEKTEVVENFDHLEKLRFSPKQPKAFTEKGLYMLATILKSPKAVETTIAIVEAYAKLRDSQLLSLRPSQCPYIPAHLRRAILSPPPYPTHPCRPLACNDCAPSTH